MLKNGLSIDLYDIDGKTILMNLAQIKSKDSKKLTSTILSQHLYLKPNAINAQSGQNPLIYSILSKNVDITKILYREEYNIQDFSSKTAFDYAQLQNNLAILSLFKSNQEIEAKPQEESGVVKQMKKNLEIEAERRKEGEILTQKKQEQEQEYRSFIKQEQEDLAAENKRKENDTRIRALKQEEEIRRKAEEAQMTKEITQMHIAELETKKSLDDVKNSRFNKRENGKLKKENIRVRREKKEREIEAASITKVVQQQVEEVVNTAQERAVQKIVTDQSMWHTQESCNPVVQYLLSRTSIFENENNIVMFKGSFVFKNFIQENIVPKDIDLEIIMGNNSLQRPDNDIENDITNLFQLEESPLKNKSIWRGRFGNGQVQNVNFSLNSQVTGLPLTLDIVIRDGNYLACPQTDWIINFDKLRTILKKDGSLTLETCDGSNATLLLNQLAHGKYYQNDLICLNRSAAARLDRHRANGLELLSCEVPTASPTKSVEHNSMNTRQSNKELFFGLA
jgi:hypothetical protein